MRIKNIDDIKVVIGKMHDSEFTDQDFGFDQKKEIFFLRSHSSEILFKEKKEFHLELYNVKEYNPLNLDKIRKGKALGGVFNYIKIKNNGLGLIIVSQDLKIVLRLSKLEGEFKIISL